MSRRVFKPPPRRAPRRKRPGETMWALVCKNLSDHPESSETEGMEVNKKVLRYEDVSDHPAVKQAVDNAVAAIADGRP
eukprot:411107-Hanusia_phi.AAC.1